MVAKRSSEAWLAVTDGGCTNTKLSVSSLRLFTQHKIDQHPTQAFTG